MFGQAKFVSNQKKNPRKNKGVVICSYSNHGGWVFFFRTGHVEIVDDLDSCETDACKAKPHWRSEWANSSTKGRAGKERIYVCVETVDSLDRPSTGCKFRN